MRVVDADAVYSCGTLRSLSLKSRRHHHLHHCKFHSRHARRRHQSQARRRHSLSRPRWKWVVPGALHLLPLSGLRVRLQLRQVAQVTRLVRPPSSPPIPLLSSRHNTCRALSCPGALRRCVLDHPRTWLMLPSPLPHLDPRPPSSCPQPMRRCRGPSRHLCSSRSNIKLRRRLCRGQPRRRRLL